jgi:hypothetical protein
MAVGFVLSKAEIDALAGQIARRFQDAFQDVGTMQAFLLKTTEPELVALGYTADDVATLKTAFTDLELLARIWVGLDPLPAPQDFRVFVSRLWGVGAF